MSISTRRRLWAPSWARPRIDLGGCVLYAPLWRPDLANSPFRSKDSVGHICTVTGTTWGKQGRTFDGNDKIVTAASASLAVNTGSFELWFKGSEAGQAGNRLVNIWTSASNNIELLFWPANTISFVVRKSWTAIVDLRKAVGITTWQHVVGTWDSSGAHLYVDGKDEVSVEGDKRATLTTPNIIVGVKGDDSGWFKGTTGDVLVYNRVLILPEVQHNYQATKWRYS